MENSNRFWKGSPSYVFKIGLLEGESYYDPSMGSINPFSIFTTAICVLIVLVEVLFDTDIKLIYFFIAVLVINCIYEIFAWQRLSKETYSINDEYFSLGKKGLVKKEGRIDEITNIYTIEESKKIHSIVISYRNEAKEDAKVKFYNIENVDTVLQLLKKK